MSKQAKSKKKAKTEVANQGKENEWYIPPSIGIPVYRAEEDPFCPMAKVRKFNDEQKLKLKTAVKNQDKSESWVKKHLVSNFQDKTVDIQSIINPNFAKKSITQSQYAPNGLTSISQLEIDTLQKIVIRERLLSELSRLIRSASEIPSVVKETVELVKVLRQETLDIIEHIIIWQQQLQGQHEMVRPFLYKGMNYLIKMASDLNFLDQYDDIIEYFCFEFTNNPLAYRGGGHMITGHNMTTLHSQHYVHGVLKSYYDSGESTVDGFDVMRLHNAEKMIQSEFNRIMQQVQIFNNNNNNNHTNIPKGASSSGAVGETTGIQVKTDGIAGVGGPPSLQDLATFEQSMMLHAANQPKKEKKEKPKRPSTAQRMKDMKTEADELAAMMSHLKEKMQIHEQNKIEIDKQVKQLEGKYMELKQHPSKESKLLHVAAELSTVKHDLFQEDTAMKNISRELYFIDLERKRKMGCYKTLYKEKLLQKQKLVLKKHIEEKIKTEGLIAALNSIDLQNGKILEKKEQGSTASSMVLKPSKKVKKDKWKGSGVNIVMRSSTTVESLEDGKERYLTEEERQAAVNDEEEEEEEEEEEDDEEGEEEEEDEEEASPIQIRSQMPSSSSGSNNNNPMTPLSHRSGNDILEYSPMSSLDQHPLSGNGGGYQPTGGGIGESSYISDDGEEEGEEEEGDDEEEEEEGEDGEEEEEGEEEEDEEEEEDDGLAVVSPDKEYIVAGSGFAAVKSFKDYK